MLAPSLKSMVSPLATVKASLNMAVPYTYVFVATASTYLSNHCLVMTELVKSPSPRASFSKSESAHATIWLSDTFIF